MIADLLIKLAIAAALIAALVAGEQYIEGIGYDRRAMEDAITMGAQKLEATGKLAKLTQEKLDAVAALATLTQQLEKSREDLQTKNAADLRTRRAGPGLRFVTTETASGCRGSGGGTEGDAVGPAKDASPAVVQLPEPLNSNLWQYAADAESLKIDYSVLYTHLHNPKLVCELLP